MLNNQIVEFDMIRAFVEILLTENVPDKVKDYRLSALRGLGGYLKYYEKSGYCEKLIMNIAEKKIKMIMQLQSKAEIDKILKPRCPHYDGNKFIPDKYNVLEEELICWSETSLLAPLNKAGTKRYMELFKKVFPEVEINI